MRYRIVVFVCLVFIGFLTIIRPQAVYAADQVVTVCNSFTGPGSITEAVADAIATGGGTVTFACPPGTLIISNAELFISLNTVTIDGGNNITLDANSISRIAYINPGATLNMQNIIVRNATSTFGGAFYNDGTLNLTNVTVHNNSATLSGGAIYNAAGRPVGITNSTFINNSAGSGGAIYTLGTVTATNTNFTNSTCVISGAGTIVNGGSNTRNAASTGCPGSTVLSANAVCLGVDLFVAINEGDAPFQITADSGTLLTGLATGSHTIPGPVNETNVTVIEDGGDGEISNLGNFTCHVPLSASAVCVGDELHVNIFAGDAPFAIIADSGTLLTGLATGTHIIPGPVNETNVTVSELAGNTQSQLLGDFDCFISETLTVVAVCVGADLQVSISNGNAPFTIDVNGNVTTGNPLGIYTYAGPDTFAVTVSEETGDLEGIAFAPITCTAPIVPVEPPSAPVVVSPDPTALGCVLTVDVAIADAPDNTYCRVLMRNGAVVNYSGAVPQSLIGLGVKLAVDVYRLDGGQSITDFGGHYRVCLSGTGRLFYLDARTSPRGVVELATERIGDATCGWIPAAGTLVLTG